MQRAFTHMKCKFLLGNAALDRINELPQEIREDCFAKMNEVAKINAPLFTFLETEWGDEAYSFDVIAFNALADYDDDLVIIRHSFPPTADGEAMLLLSKIEMAANVNSAIAGKFETANPLAN
jgi:hypothetical protein